MSHKGRWGQYHQTKMRRHYLVWHPRCVARGSAVDPQIDHIVPRLLGGSENNESNRQTLCGTCNRIKGTSSMTPAQIRDYRLRQGPAGPSGPVRTRGFGPRKRKPR
jgi:5-methylcytosine-specific restriction endonuclease McrA